MLTGEENVYIIWWETGQDRISQAVMGLSNDSVQRFGPVVILAAKGIITTSGDNIYYPTSLDANATDFLSAQGGGVDQQ